MDKIVIQTNSLERSGKIMSCLTTLFPGCQIVMQLAEVEHQKDVSRKPAHETKGDHN